MGPGRPPPTGVLEQFASRERSLAATDFGCREASNLPSTVAEVRTELEDAFFTAHVTELEAIRTALVEAADD